jgi:peptide/nickel transport system permease protein
VAAGVQPSTAMFPFILRRTVRIATLACAVAALSFAFSAWAPGSIDDRWRLEPGYAPSAAAAIRARHGLDLPWTDRFRRWAGSVAAGDFGVSIEYDVPVAPLVAVRAGRTLLLGAAGTALAWLVATPIGVLMAARQGSAFDRACRAVVVVVLVVPEPVLALACVIAAVRTGLAPAGGMIALSIVETGAGPRTAAVDVARHLALPAAVLALGMAPTIVRHVRSTMTDVLGAPYIAAARARGVPPRRLLFRSALRPAAPPLVALFGLSVGQLLSASLLVEVLTGWPGLGPLLVEATRSRDVPVVVAVTLGGALLLGTSNLAADLALSWVDPRQRQATVRSRG